MHDHTHSHPGIDDRADSHARSTRRKLTVSTIATVGFVAFELAAGIRANSLAIVGDAFHNLTDGLVLALALVAVILSRRPASGRKSFGYQRAGILAAFVNGALLLAFTVFYFVEAVGRARAPEPVDSGIMLVVAAIAIVFNGGIAAWLHRGAGGDINIRSAILHQVADALGSLGVLIAAIGIRITGISSFDSFVSLAIGVLILWTSWGILRETVNLLLEGTPQGIDPDEIARSLAAEEGVFGVHHLHVWALGPSSPALSCHLLLGDVHLRDTAEILARVNAMLARRWGIVHTTIQLEHSNCGEENHHPGKVGG
ncbi:MAG: cation diffusion facilitator family transporter [Thermoanaerobaculia bacterium]|jgi:cobalt-zinc-cadmium efflux system protein